MSERREQRMRQPERRGHGGRAAETRQLHDGSPPEHRRDRARRALECGQPAEDVCDARVRPKPPRERTGHGEQADSAKDDEDRPDRHRAGRRGDDEQQRERQRPRRGERDVDAARRPEPAGAVDRLRAERDLDRVAELGRGERVDHAADADARRRLPRADPAARRSERGAPGADGGQEPTEEAECPNREPEPVRAGERVERVRDAAAEQLRRGEQCDERENRGDRGDELGA